MNITNKRIVKLEIGCCGDCPYYNWKPKDARKRGCLKGAKKDGEGHFYEDCPLDWIIKENDK